MALAPSR